MSYTNFPEQLKEQKQWVLWKKEMVKDKWTKIPYSNTAQHASSTNPKTWNDFETIKNYVEKFSDQFNGIGYVFNEGVVGIDLDHCFQEDGFTLKQWAKEIIDLFPSYIEISPSGTGLHIFLLCKVDFKGAKHYIENQKEGDAIERYVTGRYFTVTGNVYGEYKELKTYEPEYFLKWHKSLIKEEPKILPQTLSDTLLPGDNKILEVAFKSKNGVRVKDLYNGEWKKYYRSQSEADLSLVGSLMFFCGNNTATVDRIFKNSGLMREKWNRPDIKEGIFSKTYCAEPMKWDIEEKQNPPAEHKIISLNEILKKTPNPNPFLLQGMIVEKAINALTSDSGKGKSLLMLKMVEAISTGEKFLGEFDTKQSKTLVIDLEMSEDDIIDRTQTIVGKEIDGLNFHYAQTFNIFNDDDFKWIKDIIRTEGYKLVVLDTYSMMAPSKSENDNAEANVVNKKLLEITNECDCTILFLHHHRKLQKGEIMSQSSSRGATDIIGKTASHLLITTKDITIIDDGEGLKGIKIVLEQMKRRKRTGFDRFAVNVWNNPFENKTYFEFAGFDEKAESALEKTINAILSKMKFGEEYIMSEITELIGKSSNIYSAFKILIEEQKRVNFRLPEEGEIRNGDKLKHNTKIYYLCSSSSSK